MKSTKARRAVALGFPHAMLTRPLTRAVMFGDLKIEGRG